MHRNQFVITLVAAIVGGLIGGAVSSRFSAGSEAFADKQSWKPFRTIGAEKFVVTDRQGDVRAVFGMIEKAPTLMMFGKNGSTPKIMLFDGNGCRAELVLRANGEPSLNLFDRNSNIRTALGTVTLRFSKSGEIQRLPSSLVFFDENGDVHWSTP